MTVSPAIQVRLCIEDVLRGRVPLFDGVERLLELVAMVPVLEHDRDVRKLAELRGQVEHLPIGREREHWQAEALHRVDRELMALERQHRDAVFYACRRLLETLDAAPGGGR